MNFTEDITRFVGKTKVKADTVVRSVALEAFEGCVKRSPVDTGRFRGSWRVGIGGPDLSVEAERKLSLDSPFPSPKPATPEESAAARAKLRAAHFGDTVHISNNLIYGPPLEHGHSQKQAPLGVMGITFDEVRIRLDSTIKAALLAAEQAGGAP